MSLSAELCGEFGLAYVRRADRVTQHLESGRGPDTARPLIAQLRAEMNYPRPPGARSFPTYLLQARQRAAEQPAGAPAGRQQATRLHGELRERVAQLDAEIAGVNYAMVCHPAGWQSVADRLAAALAERAAVERLLALVPAELIDATEESTPFDLRAQVARLKQWRLRLVREQGRLSRVVDECAGRVGRADVLAELRKTGVLLDLEAVVSLLADAAENLQLVAEHPELRLWLAPPRINTAPVSAPRPLRRQQQPPKKSSAG